MKLVTPSTIPSGSYTSVKIKVTNMGGKVTLDSATLYEKVITGYLAGQNATVDIPLDVSEVPAYGALVIFSEIIPVRNTTGSDVTLEDTVTVNSDGGTAKDVTDYTILHQ